MYFNLAQNEANKHPDSPTTSAPTTTPFPTTTESEVNLNTRYSLEEKCKKAESNYNKLFEKYKTALVSISELEQDKGRLEDESQMYKNNFEGLLESFGNGTLKSTNNLLLDGKTIANESPVLILNEIIRYIVGIPKTDYEIIDSHRLVNNTGVKFTVRNYQEKLNILARSHFRLMNTKFRILNTDTLHINNKKN